MSVVEGVSTEQVRAELDLILSTPAFVRSPRLGRLLTYLCTKALAGEADQIKEYTIGVEVMGRPPTFDPAEDANARVEVHRLRKRLREYYEKEGVAAKLRIVVPNGQYVPKFTLVEAAPPPPRLPPLAPKRPFWLPGVVALVLALAAAAVLLLTHRTARLNPTQEPAQPRGEAPRVVASQSVRLACGQRQPHIDRVGRQWLADQYFEGGTSLEQPRLFIARAFEPRLFNSARTGDFSYDLPLAPGT
jgi:hypothetical protein